MKNKLLLMLSQSSNIKIIVFVIFCLFISCQKDYKKEARDFIYGSIDQKFSVEKKIINNKGEAIQFSPYDFETLYQAKDSLAFLLKNNLTFNSIYEDTECVPDSFIKKHIDLMLEIREESAFLRHVNFEQFCEYVLPYRCEEEKFVNYHLKINQLFQRVFNELPENATVSDAVIALNTELKRRLKFDLRSHAQLKEPDILEVLKTGKGSCNSLTMVTALTMRRFGIPVAVDECPVWAHRNSGHRWNAVLDASGLWIPFGGAETNPDEFDTINDSVKAPKIFRQTFSDQKGFQPPFMNVKDLPTVFRKANRIDVTTQYVVTNDVEVEIESITNHINDTTLYLAVFNAERWRVVAWASIKDERAIFNNMGANNIVYMPVFYRDGEIIPASYPFILSPQGQNTIVVNLQNKTDIKIPEYNKFYDIRWNIGIPQVGWKMELFYWDNRWVTCGICNVENDRTLRFSKVPNNGLYLVKSHHWQNTWQRVFSIEEGKQIWY